MVDVNTYELFPNIRLTSVTTDKFKTGCLSVNLVGHLSRETAASSALLPRVLRRGCKEYPDIKRLATALDELYGARVEPIVRKKGELHCVGFYADFPDDRYVPAGEGLLEKTASLLGSVLLAPDLDGGLLRADYVESEKSILIDDIRAAINDKRGYSIDRLLEEMCAGEAFGVNRLGGEKEAEAITPKHLTEHYMDVLSNSPVEVFYCGSSAPEHTAQVLRSALRDLPEKSGVPVPKTNVVYDPPCHPPRRVTESLDVTQGKLAVGFRLGKAMEAPDYPAFMVFNSLYGGSVSSKLFRNVRERLSLCYYANSMLDKYKGVMVVSSGVDFSNFETALDEIQAQLAQVKNGDISELELTSAKRYVITSIKAAMDRPGGLEDLYFDRAVAAIPYDPADLCEQVEAVTPGRVVDTASGIKPDTIYFLRD